MSFGNDNYFVENTHNDKYLDVGISLKVQVILKRSAFLALVFFCNLCDF